MPTPPPPALGPPLTPVAGRGPSAAETQRVEPGQALALPEGALARFGLPRLRHAGAIAWLRFAATGAALESGGEDGLIRRWDPATGHRVAEAALGADGVLRASNADGSVVVATTARQDLLVWEPASGAPPRTIPLGATAVHAVALSGDAAVIAVATQDSGVRLISATSGEELQRFELQAAIALAFSHDGKHLAAGTFPGALHLYDLTTGSGRIATERSAQRMQGTIRQLVFAPDDALLAVCDSSPRIKLLDVVEGARFRALAGHRTHTHSVAFSSDGKRLAAGGQGGAVRVWEVATGQLLHQPAADDGDIVRLAFSRDGQRLAAATDENAIAIFDLASGSALGAGWAYGHHGPCTAATLTPDGARVFTGGTDGTVRVWDASSGIQTAVLRLDEDAEVAWLALTPDGATLLLATVDRELQVWDAASLRLQRRAHLWAAATEAAWKALRQAEDSPSLALSPDGRTLAIGELGVTLVDVATLRLTLRLARDDLEETVDAVSWSADGRRLAAGTSDGDAWIWDLRSPKAPPVALHSADAEILDLAFSPDAARLGTGSEAGFVIFDLAKAAPERDHPLRDDGERGTWQMAFTPDGKHFVASYEDAATRAFDAATGALVTTLSGHEGELNSLEVSADGQRVLTTSNDGTAILWGLRPGLR